jgi:hypothetical protein
MSLDQWITAITAAAMAINALNGSISVALRWRESRRAERDQLGARPAQAPTYDQRNDSSGASCEDDTR